MLATLNDVDAVVHCAPIEHNNKEVKKLNNFVRFILLLYSVFRVQFKY